MTDKIVKIKYGANFDKQVVFNNSHMYELDTSDCCCFGPLSGSVLHNLYKDGRVSGLIIEDLLVGTFKNLSKYSKANDIVDIYNNVSADYYQVKVLTNSLRTCPSHMVGKGRNYDEVAHLAALNKLDYFIVVDVQSSPIFKVYVLSSNRNLLFRTMSRESFLSNLSTFVAKRN